MIPLYHLHPIAVHFPIALLIAGFFVHVISLFSKKKDWLPEVVSWFLWVGTLSIWAAVGSGLLAENTAPHVAAAWEVQHEHEIFGFWTAGVFSTLSLFRIFVREKYKYLFLFIWAIGVVLILLTGMHGGQLVFDFGVGVSNLE